jgi:NAD(P)-dependent dehydrogenase (short-subunit alcohol dehydrogenase family)
MRLKGKVAIVTGGTKGVGRGIAHRFAEEGASVVLTGRSEDLGRAVEREIRDAGGKALFVRADISIEDDCRRMVEVAEERFGPLTTLVNNAAATHMIGTLHPHADRRMHELSNETLDIMWKSDLYGLFWCCRYALRVMLAHGRPGCSIVNISSGAAQAGYDMDAYVASKAAMNGITHSMAGEYAKSGIRVNAIALGLINNGGGVAAMMADEAIAAAVTSVIPLSFVGEPDDIAWGAVYLASDEAKYLTGVVLPIDGGASGCRVAEDQTSKAGWADTGA